MFYGEPATGKSEGIAAMIEQAAVEAGLSSRVLIGDGSKATYEALADAGIVEVLDYTTRDYPISTFQ